MPRWVVNLAVILSIYAPVSWGQSIIWEAPVDLSIYAGLVGDDFEPRAATDGAGNWVCVWYSDANIGSAFGNDDDIFVARSTDDGETWSQDPSAAISAHSANDDGNDRQPDIATDGNGVYVVVWSSGDNLEELGFNLGFDEDIVFARSVNNGASWSTPAPLHPSFFDGSMDLAGSPDNNTSIDDKVPRIATDENGTWVVTWRTTNRLGGTDFAEFAFSRSTDNGVTWSVPERLVNAARKSVKGVFNSGITLATDQAGNWVAAWESHDDLGIEVDSFDNDIHYARSSDNGATWSPPAFLNTSLLTDGQTDAFPEIATDGRGVWIVAWHAFRFSDGENDSGSDFEIVAWGSKDNGMTFSPTTLVSSFAFTDERSDENASIATDGRGNWVVAWDSLDSFGDLFEAEGEPYFSVSTDDGTTWRTADTLNVHPEIGLDEEPFLAVDGAGNFRAFWETSEPISDSQNRFSPDPVTAKTSFTGNVQGMVTSLADESPVSNAALRALSDDGLVDRIVVTDANGGYGFLSLPQGDYTFTVFARIGSEDSSVQTATTSVDETVTAGGLTVVDFELNFEALEGGVSGVVRGVPVADEPVDILFGARVDARINDVVVATTYSSGDGSYAINGLVEANKGVTEVILTFTAAGHITDDRIVMIDPPANAESNPTLDKAAGVPAALFGVITDGSDDTPVESARITVAGRANLHATSETNGAYDFVALPEGRYDITVSAAGYTTQSKLMTLPSAAISNADFALAPEGQTDPADINGDGSVNAVDVQLVINDALGIDISPRTGDVNGDNATDAVDIQLVINAALGVA